MIVKKLETKELSLKGAFIIEPLEFRDSRGVFYKTYTEEILAASGTSPRFSEEFLTISNKDVIRGFHYQAGEHAQTKLITCIKGTVFDVIVDLRKSSETYGKWISVELSEKNMRALYVPKGFAHAFASLSDSTTLLYRAAGKYSAEHERGILWNDPDLNISWPIKDPILSEKDGKWPNFKDAEKFD